MMNLKTKSRKSRRILTDSKSEEVRTLVFNRDNLLMAIGAAQTKESNFQGQMDNKQKTLDSVVKLIEDKDKHDNIKENLERQSDLIERCVTAFESVLNNLSEVKKSNR